MSRSDTFRHLIFPKPEAKNSYPLCDDSVNSNQEKAGNFHANSETMALVMQLSLVGLLSYPGVDSQIVSHKLLLFR